MEGLSSASFSNPGTSGTPPSPFYAQAVQRATTPASLAPEQQATRDAEMQRRRELFPDPVAASRQ